VDQPQSSQTDFLRTALARDTASFRVRRTSNRRKAFGNQIVATLSGALTTVLLGLKANAIFASAEPYMSALALVLSATATLFATWEAFFDHRWLWVRYTATLSELYSISDDLEYAAAGGHTIPQDKLDDLHRRRQQTLMETSNAWSDKRAREAINKTDGTKK
jgi:hypothetical protein